MDFHTWVRLLELWGLARFGLALHGGVMDSHTSVRPSRWGHGLSHLCVAPRIGVMHSNASVWPR